MTRLHLQQYAVPNNFPNVAIHKENTTHLPSAQPDSFGSTFQSHPYVRKIWLAECPSQLRATIRQLNAAHSKAYPASGVRKQQLPVTKMVCLAQEAPASKKNSRGRKPKSAVKQCNALFHPHGWHVFLRLVWVIVWTDRLQSGQPQTPSPGDQAQEGLVCNS